MGHSLGPDTHTDTGTVIIMDIKDKPEFDYFMQRALASFKSGAGTDDCYIELYNILLRAFVSADVDFDGKIGVEEFDQMIENAASLPRKFGYKWWGEETYADDASRIKAHEDLFKTIVVLSPSTNGWPTHFRNVSKKVPSYRHRWMSQIKMPSSQNVKPQLHLAARPTGSFTGSM